MEYKSNPNGHCKLCTNKDEWGKLAVCSCCDRWLHLECLALKSAPKDYICPKCEEDRKNAEALRQAVMQGERLLKDTTAGKEKAEKIKDKAEAAKAKAEIAKEKAEKAKEKAEKEAEILQQALLKAEQIIRDMEIERARNTSEDEQDPHERELELLTEALEKEKKKDSEPPSAIDRLVTSIERMVQAWPSTSKGNLTELPEFTGDYKVWPRFKQIYDETTRVGKFSNLENMNRLQSTLKVKRYEQLVD